MKQSSRPNLVANIGYEFLPHTTDAYIQVTAQTIEQGFELAGMALFDTMCDAKSVEHAISDEIHAEGRDEVSLLYDWLELLPLKFELENKVYSKFKVGRFIKTQDVIQLQAEVTGELFNREKHGSKVEVKAVTYHNMAVVREGPFVKLTFILDL